MNPKSISMIHKQLATYFKVMNILLIYNIMFSIKFSFN